MATAQASPHTLDLPVTGMMRVMRPPDRRDASAPARHRGGVNELRDGQCASHHDDAVDWDAVQVAVEKVGYRVAIPTVPLAPRPGPVEFAVEGMTCGSCAARIQKVLTRQEGVERAEVNFATGRAVAIGDGPVDADTLTQAVEKIGYGLVSLGAGDADDKVSAATRAQAAEDAETAHLRMWRVRIGHRKRRP